RDHEGGEEALDDPGAPVASDLSGLPGLAAAQHGTEMPGLIARLDEIAIQPHDVGNREHDHWDHCRAEHAHREQVLPVPIPAAERVKRADDEPGYPQADELGDRNVDHLRKRPRAAP